MKILYILNWSRGWGHRKSFVSQIQNSPNYPGGGSRKLWTFYTICDIFFLMAPLRKIGYLLARGYLYYAEIEYYNQLCVQNLIQMKKILQLGGVWWSDQVEIRLTQLSTELNFSNFNTVRFF